MSTLRTMRAVVLSAPGSVENLEVRTLPIPVEREGWVRIRVEAFGLNRSELHTRLGLAEGVVFPRVLGIECTGAVDSAPENSGLTHGQKVVAMMGGMGRTFDGGYAEYTSVPIPQVIPINTELPWETVGALPEMLQTAYGCLTTGLDLRRGQSLLIRGGTSSIGMAAAALAKEMGAVVLSTTRRADRVEHLKRHGVDHPIIDNGEIKDAVRAIVPEGVHAALELIGTPSLPDTLRSTRVHGTVCFAGMLSNEWVVKDFYPIGYIPTGVRLTAYGGNASDLPAEVFQRQLDAIAAGRLSIAVHKVYDGLDQIREAHRDMESNQAIGKLVVRVRHK
jgi:NADPH:quinone reductase